MKRRNVARRRAERYFRNSPRCVRADSRCDGEICWCPNVVGRYLPFSVVHRVYPHVTGSRKRRPWRF